MTSDMKPIIDAPIDGTMILIPPYVLCHSAYGQHLTELPTLVHWSKGVTGKWEWRDREHDIFEPEVFWDLPDMSMISKPGGLN